MYATDMMSGWMMTGSWSSMHWLVFVIMIALVLYPIGVILRKLGFSPLLAVLACVPLVNLIGLWIVALSASTVRNNKANSPDLARPQN